MCVGAAKSEPLAAFCLLEFLNRICINCCQNRYRQRARSRKTKLINKQQLQQIIHTDIVWSGCSTYSVIHPLRVLLHLGPLRVAALVDTGSDYDALDADLSQVQEQKNNPAFRKRVRNSTSVTGFAAGMKLKSEFTSSWELTLTGAPVWRTL